MACAHSDHVLFAGMLSCEFKLGLNSATKVPSPTNAVALRRLAAFVPLPRDTSGKQRLHLLLCQEVVSAAILAHAEPKPSTTAADGPSSGYDWRRIRKDTICVGKSSRSAVAGLRALRSCKLQRAPPSARTNPLSTFTALPGPRSVDAVQRGLREALVKERLGAALLTASTVEGLSIALAALSQVRSCVAGVRRVGREKRPSHECDLHALASWALLLPWGCEGADR